MIRKVKAVITNAIGDRVIVGNLEFEHALEGHFEVFPEYMVLELLEKILRDPTVVYVEKKTSNYFLFYKLENEKYIVAIVKKVDDECYFSTMYPTGKDIRNKHKSLKKVNLK